jgi:hypothetical protein
MTEQAAPLGDQKQFKPTTAVLLILPLIVLGGVILLFLNTGVAYSLRRQPP